MSQNTNIDLDALERAALAATEGPWEWWTSNSVLRLTGADGIDGGVLCGHAHRGVGDIICGESNRRFIAAANPAVVLNLIRELREVRTALASRTGGERAAALEEAAEGAQLVDDMIANVEKHGSYSKDTTLVYLGQIKQCLDPIRALATQPAQQANAGREHG